MPDSNREWVFAERPEGEPELIEHFSRFGDCWGVDPANVDTEE